MVVPNFDSFQQYVRRVGKKTLKLFKRILGLDRPKGADVSQHGESEILRRIWGKGYCGYLVEIGAHDGSSLSNSSLLIDSGWRGVLIEPLPGPFNKLVQRYSQNSNIICLNLAISNLSGHQRFFIGTDGPEGMMSTLCDDNNAWFAQARSESAIEVCVDTVTNILSQHNVPKNFDLLLIDTEGMDYECLLGMDFELFCPHVIVTEIYQWNSEKHAKKEKLLKQNGYVLYQTVGCNTIWVRK